VDGQSKITGVLVRERRNQENGNQRRCDEASKGQRDKMQYEHARPLILKMEEGVTSQEMQTASRTWKRQGNTSSTRVRKRSATLPTP